MKNYIFFFGTTVVATALIFTFLKPEDLKINSTVENLKYDNCVTEMQGAIPDPNDTEARSTFLKNCYE